MCLLLAACAGPQGPSAPASPGPTGVAELDAIVAATLSGDASQLRSFIGFTQARCTSAQGLGGPPKCAAAEPEGTPVEVLPLLGPEGSFIRQEEMESWGGLRAAGLYAAYEVSDAAYSDENYPAGEYALVFSGPAEAPGGFTLQVTQGRIVRIDYAQSNAPLIRAQDIERYLVVPLLGSP